MATITASDLSKLGFNRTHTIEIDAAGVPEFHSKSKGPIKASVYMWLSELGAETYNVLYVGKAGAGIDRRCSQHRGGFTNSGTGKGNSRLIKSHIDGGRKIVVFSRVSEQFNQFGATVSAYSSEEEALCEAFKPQWNRARFPLVNQSTSLEQLAGGTPTQVSIPVEAASVVGQLDLSALVGAQDVQAHIDSLPEVEKDLFVSILQVLSSLPFFAQQPQKVVIGYTNQISGYNGIPMLVLSEVGPAGNALPNAWAARVPLVGGEKMTIIFNARFLRDSADARVTLGPNGEFMPTRLSDLLSSPYRYLNV